MYNTQITLGWLRERTKDLPDNTVIGSIKQENDYWQKFTILTPEPYTDWDVNGDQYLFQVDPETGILVLGYNF